MLPIQDLSLILGALGPIFFMIVLGYLLRRWRFPGDVFWPGAERLTYFLLFPALLVRELASANLRGYAVAPFAGVIVTSLGFMTLLLFALRPLLKVNGSAFSSLYQGSIRFNTYVGLAAANALFHATGVALAALAMAILIPLLNVLCVGVLIRATGTQGAASLFEAMLHNPLILACLVGVLLNFSGLGVPLGTEAVLDILAPAALPLGLLAVGAGLQVRAALAQKRLLVLATALKLLVLPILTWLISSIVGLNDRETGVLVLFSALPGAPASYVLARQLGGDAQLMAAILTAQTALSLLTLPLILLCFA